MLKRVIGAFIIFSPFTSYFAISSWLRFPVLMILFIYLFFFIKIIIKEKIPATFARINPDDIILAMLYGTILISFLINEPNPKGFNHCLAYGFTFFAYYIFFRRVVEYEKIDLLFVLRMLAISSWVCGLIIVTDWFLVNFLSIKMREFFVAVDYRVANTSYYQNRLFLAVAGVAEEPGSMALILNVIAPAGLLYYKIQKKFKAFFIMLCLYAICLLFLASTAGIVNCLLAFAGVVIINLSEVKISWHIRKDFFYPLVLFLGALAVIGPVLIVKNYAPIVDQVKVMAQKVSLSSASVSPSVRMKTWRLALENWQENPILGKGPGYGNSIIDTGYHSVYLNLLADAGILSALLFLLFLMLQIIRLLQIRSLIRNYLLFAFITGAIHFAIVGDFYHAPFWILLIAIYLARDRKIPDQRLSAQFVR